MQERCGRYPWPENTLSSSLWLSAQEIQRELRLQIVFPQPMRFMLKYVMMPIVFPLMGGMVHTLEVGAKRFVDAISDERYKSGVFYASKEGKLSGDMVDQSTFFTYLKNTSFQDNANEAIHHFIKLGLGTVLVRSSLRASAQEVHRPNRGDAPPTFSRSRQPRSRVAGRRQGLWRRFLVAARITCAAVVHRTSPRSRLN